MQLRVGPRATGPCRWAFVWSLCALLAGCDRIGLWGTERSHTVLAVIERAPGPFGHVSWHADYRAEDCPDGAPSGGGDLSVALPVTHKGEHHYETTVPARPAAGTGQDRCRWQLVSTSARLAATNAEGDEVFEARLTAEQLDRGRPLVLYYWRGTYPRMPGAIITRSLGEPDRQVFRPEFQNQLFTITLTPRAAQ
ncbi:hypothetical protein [Hydrogenophaga luteola]|uniref:Lipoprotein n=1 Tax=Hydrogenophaga luteola TaxID=1591122 RepID=A0ABV7W057_9BURK